MQRTPEDEPQDDDLARARDVLERTKRFLAQCAQDPKAALAAEDPRELIRGLEALSVQPEATPENAPAEQPANPGKEPRTIPIRRRRSA